MIKELRVYKTRPLANVAIMNFYKDNKPNIKKVYSNWKSQGIVMKDGNTVHFKTVEILQTDTKKFNKVIIY